eukprot:1154938-Pelagomonas_calceolata.AAC.2
MQNFDWQYQSFPPNPWRSSSKLSKHRKRFPLPELDQVVRCRPNSRHWRHVCSGKHALRTTQAELNFNVTSQYREKK